MFIENNAIK